MNDAVFFLDNCEETKNNNKLNKTSNISAFYQQQSWK